jgi:hypothetical protein
MRVIVICATVLAALSLPSNEAHAAPWCAHYNTGLNDCGSYYTFEQCRAAVSGVGGFCSQNPFEAAYFGGAEARRRHRRAY